MFHGLGLNSMNELTVSVFALLGEILLKTNSTCSRSWFRGVIPRERQRFIDMTSREVRAKPRRAWTSLLALGLVGALFSAQAVGFTEPPNTIGLTIEGCRNDGTPPITPDGTLPNADGRFTCQDPAPLGGNDNPYTTGQPGQGME